MDKRVEFVTDILNGGVREVYCLSHTTEKKGLYVVFSIFQ